MATFYDRDGDGRYEEARRSSTTYFDRNGDRIADLHVEGDTGGDEGVQDVLWDSDFDGILDHGITAEVGYVFRLVNERPVHSAGSPIFRIDSVRRPNSLSVGVPEYRHWEAVAGVPPWKPKEKQAAPLDGP